jgi:photosystem II stability/assembly factor-like uncharacterized protein
MKKYFIFFGFFATNFAFSQDWFQIPSGTTTHLNAIDFPTEMVGYVAGNDGVLLKTINGGADWASITYSGIDFVDGTENDHLLNLKFVSEQIGYIAVGPLSNGVFKTINGGLDWELVAPAEEVLCAHYGLYFFGEDDGFVGGEGCESDDEIQRIGLDGLSNTTISGLPSSTTMVVDFDFFDANLGIAVTGVEGNGKIIRTTDGGLNWTYIFPGLPAGSELTSVRFMNENLVYVGYRSSELSLGLLRSDDGGLSWTYDIESTTFYYPNFNALHESDNGFLYVGADTDLDPNGVIFEKTSESFWNFYPVEERIFGLSSYRDSIVWAVGENGYIVVNQDPIYLKIDELNNNVSVDLILSPNPVINQLTIVGLNQVEIDYFSDAKVEIVNLLGEVLYQSNFMTEIDLGHFDAGIYFLAITKNGAAPITSKFVIE